MSTHFSTLTIRNVILKNRILNRLLMGSGKLTHEPSGQGSGLPGSIAPTAICCMNSCLLSVTDVLTNSEVRSITGLEYSVEILTGAVRLITDSVQAEEILSSRKADLIIMVKELLRNPYFPLKAAKESAFRCNVRSDT